MRVWKQWTDEYQTIRKTGSGRRKVMSARHDRDLLRRVGNDLQLPTGSWKHVGLLLQVYKYRFRQFVDVCCTVDYVQGAWQADWYQDVFSDESRFNLWDHDSPIRVRRYAGERCFPECVIERHSGLTPEVLVWVRFRNMDDPICYELSIPGAIFQQDNDARPHVAMIVQDFCSAQRMQVLPWPAYSVDMSLIEHGWDLVVRRLALHSHPAASIYELLLHIQAIWNSLPQADIQNMFDSMPYRIVALIAVRGGYIKYRFRTLNIVFLL
ncbi:transposable element Tcb1 transposase [Trichonephila clavipes]|nr:transposable element Tcb1 transposase [Trichonephila clavipes]